MAHESVTRKIRVGDRLVFYVTRTDPPSIKGIYEIATNWHETIEPIWADEKEAEEVLYPFRVGITPIILGSANLRELKDRLHFIKNKGRYAVYLRGTPANREQPIPDSDYQTILDAVRATQST